MLDAVKNDLLEAAEAMYAELFDQYGHGLRNGYWPDLVPLMWKARDAIVRAGGKAEPLEFHKPKWVP